MCETLTEVLAIELQTLGCLGRHILQLSNVMAVLVHLRPLVSAGIAADLATADGELTTAINELTASRRSRAGCDCACRAEGRACIR